MEKPVILITMGDPAGVGPEVVLKALRSPEIYWRAIPVIMGDRRILEHTRDTMGIDLRWRELGQLSELDRSLPGPFLLSTSSIPLEGFRWGHPRTEDVLIALKYVTESAKLIRDGLADAVVTAPIGQYELATAGYMYPGQSEFLQAHTHTKLVSRMMVGDNLKIAIVTGHKPIRELPASITLSAVYEVIKHTNHTLRDGLDVADPSIAVTSFNPHSGTSGLPGREEEEAIKPAIAQARAEGMNVVGPLSSSEMLLRTTRGEFSAGVVMYHDQGVGPFKLLHLDLGLTITLGLPFIRTAAVHGPAFEVAGQGRANYRSILGAIITAANLARKNWLPW